MSNKKLWFKARKYGWGWTPITWQGWMLVVGYVVLVTALAISLLPHAGEELGVVYITTFGLFLVSLTSFLIGISYRKGEPPSWQWGDKPKKRTDKDESK